MRTWFILLFLGAAVLNTYVSTFAPAYPWLLRAGHIGITVTLFLIGTGLSRASLKVVGARPLLHGLISPRWSGAGSRPSSRRSF